MRRGWIEPEHPTVSLVTQCQLLGLSRSGWYATAVAESVLNQELRGRIDQEYTAHPFYGSRRMTTVLRRAGYPVNRNRVIRLMTEMGLQAIYPKPATSTPHPDHQIYPYLLRGVIVTVPDQVWSTDITYIHLPGGLL
ncbi:MAG: IS3 family transposase [Candidatus Contendobacter sp.]|nr:IS3 family transposase [Candidatus Contendobacter sp.]